MLISSRGVALLIAICISAITIAFLSLLDDVSAVALTVTFIISFATSYLLINIVLEFLIFKEINSIYNVLEKLKKKDFFFTEAEDPKKSFNPLRKINTEISNYAAFKQNEIEELKRMADFRREFLADVSHELKTPIFAAQGFVHTLLDGADKDSTVRRKFLKKAAKSLDGLEVIVSDLLTLSHMEAGEITMHKELFDLKQLTDELIDQLEDKADKKSISIEYDVDYLEPIYIYADKERIYRVMTNLISNGIKYSEDEKTITIKFEIKKKEVTIIVKDQGLGIEAEHLNRIFERFYRIEKSRSKQMGGSGLGLAIVKHIVEAHGSKVHVESTVGVGSSFSFKLKREKEESKNLLK